ncbi:hypothetical protein KAR91_70205 [Candidatus Pacearchaeota archaeon]|nr:hypothetical protein [Candidatus Pacearchaeota archaeon]
MRGKAEDQILKILIDRNPNFVAKETVIRVLSKKYNLVQLDDAFKVLLESKQIESCIDSRKISGSPVTYYRMKDPNLYPVRPSISLGDMDVPRLLCDSSPTYLPETLNEQIELLADYTDKLEKRFIKLVEKQQRRYWSNLIGIFGALLSVMALVITGLPKITVTSTMTFEEVFLVNSAQILPIALVLTLFVIALRIIVR